MKKLSHVADKILALLQNLEIMIALEQFPPLVSFCICSITKNLKNVLLILYVAFYRCILLCLHVISLTLAASMGQNEFIFPTIAQS